MDFVGIGRDGAQLTLDRAPRTIDNLESGLHVALVVEAMSAATSISPHHTHGWSDLLQWFQDVGQEWMGWRGEKTWMNAEKNCRLAATHQGSSVTIVVQLWQHPGALGWCVSAPIHLDAGAELSDAIGRVTRLLGTA